MRVRDDDTLDMRVTLALGLVAMTLASCSARTTATALPAREVKAAPPPRDDGSASRGDEPKAAHAAALEQLGSARIELRSDKQNSVLVPLPDAEHWTRVRFLTFKTLVGFRYGKAHHAVVGGVVIHVDDNKADSACSKGFEQWAKPFVEAFEVELSHNPPTAFTWSPPTTPSTVKSVAIVEVDPLVAKTATLFSRETYVGAWAAYPVWDNACLIVGAAVPMQGEAERARHVRDRFVREVFPNVKLVAAVEPKERY